MSIRFGIFELSQTTGSLRKNGLPVRLPPQPTQILLLLVERAGEIVTREEIQRLTWADDTVVDFEVGINRCVRRIRSALLDDADAPRYLETIPRVGYRFIAPVEIHTPATNVPPSSVHNDAASPLVHKAVAWKPILFITVLSSLSLAAAYWFWRSRPVLPVDLHSVPLAVSLGDQYTPAFSPDGRQVAFSWNGDGQDNFDIYLKLADSSASALRLTKNKDVDYGPAWSPDGHWIAFCRGTDTPGGAVWIVPALGGAERKVIDLKEPGNPWNRPIAWDRDSKKLVVSGELAGQSPNGLHLVDLNTGAITQITIPIAPEEDMYPAVSPDGETIAFTRDVGRGVSHIFVVPLAGGTPRLIPAPQPRDIYNARPSWTPDGRSVVFISNAGGINHVWLSPVWQSGTVTELAALGDGVEDASVSPSGQLGLVHQGEDSNLWTIGLGGLSSKPAAKAAAKPKELFASTQIEESPALRSDGKQIAFASNRSGYTEIWTGRTDGTDAMQITFLQRPNTGSPDWSPDGRRIVFDSREGERPQLHTVSPNGGSVQALPTSGALSVVPRWSPDGRYIYFSSDQTGRMEIWRLSSNGGAPEQITKGGGFAPVPSKDGSAIYYSSDNAPITSLWTLDLASRTSTLIASSVERRAYVPSSAGIYFFLGATGLNRSSLLFRDKQSGRATYIFDTDHKIGNGITLAPDERTLYYTQVDLDDHQLLLVRKFWRK